MATTKRRKRLPGGSKITERLIEAWTRLKELEAMDLPVDDPRRMAHGEMMTLRAEIHKALDIKPWPTESDALLGELEAAAGWPYQAELEAVAEKRAERARLRAEEWLRQGIRPVGETLEDALDKFEDRWGYRPQIKAFAHSR